MNRARRAHWLRANHANRYPRRIVCLDTEADRTLDGNRETHRLMLAVASFDVIDRATLQPRRSEQSAFVDADELWDWIVARTAKKERTCLFAHNLGYDLRLSRALLALPARGFKLDSFSLDAYRCWMRWRGDGRTLLMVDTMSFVGRALGGLALELGVPYTEMPGPAASMDEWLARCKGDVALLRKVVLRLLSWLEENEAGNFRMTGSAQASAFYRHRYLPQRRLLVHEDEEALAAERRSAWSGRCEVWHHGQVRETVYEWDYSLAYTRLGRDALLPARYRGEVRSVTLARVQALARKMCVLAEVEITTDTPVVPAEEDGRILWPTGTFTTTLWDVELALAVEEGATVTVRRAWLYAREPLLREWAEWIIPRLEGPDREPCPIIRSMLKQWSRSTIGRFGLRYPRWEQAGESPTSDLQLLPFTDGDTGERGTYLLLGHQVLEQGGTEESPDSCPGVMAYVMALARVRLWRAMRALPAGSLLYVDTDSLLVTAAGSQVCERLAAEPLHEGLRLKGAHRGGRFLAPRQYELGKEVRVAGLPKNARKLTPSTFSAELWEGPTESIRGGHPDAVIVARRTVRVNGRDRRRRHHPGGRTEAVTLGDE